MTTILENDRRVDLVVLNDASIELRYAIIACGIVVYEVNVNTRLDTQAAIR